MSVDGRQDCSILKVRKKEKQPTKRHIFFLTRHAAIWSKERYTNIKSINYASLLWVSLYTAEDIPGNGLRHLSDVSLNR